jgi:hypothetical protein
MKIKNILMLTSIFFIILVIPIGAGYGEDDNGNAETEDHKKDSIATVSMVQEEKKRITKGTRRPAKLPPGFSLQPTLR